MSTSAHTVVRLGPEHQEEVLRLDQWGFVFGEADLLEDLFFFEWDRTFGVRAPDGTLAGLNTTFSLGLTVPDGVGGAGVRTVPMAGLSWVAVHPGQRRRGVLRAMMTDHLHGLHERGEEAVAGLHASEAVIYQRYGYGLATTGLRLTLGRAPEPVPRRRLRRGAGGLRDGVRRAARRPGARRVRAGLPHPSRGRAAPGALRPGRACWTSTCAAATSSRCACWWRVATARPPATRCCAARSTGRTATRTASRRCSRWSPSTRRPRTPSGPASPTSTSAAAPSPRRCRSTTRCCGCSSTPAHRGRGPATSLWLRLIDVDRALAQRTYAHDVDVVLDVSDALCPWNARRWRLSGGPDGATCTPTSDPADVEVDVKQARCGLRGRRAARGPGPGRAGHGADAGNPRPAVDGAACGGRARRRLGLLARSPTPAEMRVPVHRTPSR
nr:GNAT family N-acetyltransferase [Angustibacter aerolatus]